RERREIVNAVGAQRRDPRDGPRHDTADQELVDRLLRDDGGVELHAEGSSRLGFTASDGLAPNITHGRHALYRPVESSRPLPVLVMATRMSGDSGQSFGGRA